VHFRSNDEGDSPVKLVEPQSKSPLVGDFETEGETLIRDERGVRLARNTDEDGD
jgi:hypothetical protein